MDHGERSVGFKVAGCTANSTGPGNVSSAPAMSPRSGPSPVQWDLRASRPHGGAYVCKKLGLQPEPAATQVIPRDRHAEYVCELAVVAAC